MAIYHYSQGTSNKFWRYDIRGNHITYTWGRVGTEGQSKTETYFRHKLEKKINEKIAKGYVEVTSQDLAKEELLAGEIGHQNTIIGIQPVRINATSPFIEVSLSREVSGQESDKIVTVANSWTKNVSFYLLSNTYGCMSVRKVEHESSKYSIISRTSRTADAISHYLGRVVAETMQLIQDRFGNLGDRLLDNDEVQSIVSQVSTNSGSSMSKEAAKYTVVTSFQELGVRVLDI